MLPPGIPQRPAPLPPYRRPPRTGGADSERTANGQRTDSEQTASGQRPDRELARSGQRAGIERAEGAGGLQVNGMLQAAAEGPLKGILGFETEPLVRAQPRTRNPKRPNSDA